MRTEHASGTVLVDSKVFPKRHDVNVEERAQPMVPATGFGAIFTIKEPSQTEFRAGSDGAVFRIVAVEEKHHRMRTEVSHVHDVIDLLQDERMD